MSKLLNNPYFENNPDELYHFSSWFIMFVILRNMYIFSLDLDTYILSSNYLFHSRFWEDMYSNVSDDNILSWGNVYLLGESFYIQYQFDTS